jgi:hypothetical protein
MISILLMLAMAQQPCTGGAPSNNEPGCVPASDIISLACGAMEPENRAKVAACNTVIKPPAPLTCPKYQHVEHWVSGACGLPLCDEKTGTCSSLCGTPPPDRCVDDVHWLTEREWQKLMERLKKLERR